MNSVENARAYMALSDKALANGHFVNIFTITLICKLNTSISIHYMASVFNEPGVRVKKPTDNVHFHNQMTLTFSDISNKSIKMFANGTLQITGLSSYLECDDLCDSAVRWVRKYARGDIDPSSIQVSSKYIPMMNAKVATFRQIDLLDTSRNLRRLVDGVICLYNPETYPGLNVKILARRLSVLVFRTGNIVISGCKCIEDIDYVYGIIRQAVVGIGAPVDNSVAASSNNKHNNVMMCHGYPIKSLMSCSYRG